MKFSVFDSVDKVSSEGSETSEIMANDLWFFELPMIYERRK